MGFLKKFSQHLVAPKAETTLNLFNEYVVLGDNLEGTFTVISNETFDADEVRCELDCTETTQVLRSIYDPTLKRMVTRQVTENRILYQVNPVCNPATQIVTGVRREFRFNINLPAGGRPTLMSANDEVRWEIKGVVAVHGRPDLTTEIIQFQVIPESQRPANQAPKVRLITCEYCQTAMPETDLACPNCGARRKT